jgi:DNA-binding response OmpR family regulator
VALSPVLVLDDDPETARVASRVLSARGYEVTFTTDPEEALRLANRLVPDLLIIDAANPALRGPHLVRVLRTRSATALIPAIFLGERRHVESLVTGFKLGADAFLAKPLDPGELEAQADRAGRERQKAETSIRPNPGKGEFTVSPMHSAFRGNLEELALPSLLTLLDMERKTGMLVLLLEPEGEKARLFLRRGALVRAKLDARETPRDADLVYDLLSRTRGKFDFRTQPVDGDDAIRAATATLLLEGARRLDETRRLRA